MRYLAPVLALELKLGQLETRASRYCSIYVK
jgi:hypothetical protein